MTQRVLFFHYTVTNNKGEVLDSSRDGKPMPVLEGGKQILPALESNLFEMAVGDQRKVALEAAQAYGEFQENLKVKVPRTKLPEGDIKIGTQFRGGPNPQDPIFTVKDIAGEEVLLDGNHPLAGEALNFDVEVTEVREATAEELSHGHAHGPEGHHH